MGVTLERVQNKFACIIGELCNEPVILSQFAIWVDMRIAEYKAKGAISLECSGEEPDPTWLQGHKTELQRSNTREITDMYDDDRGAHVSYNSGVLHVESLQDRLSPEVVVVKEEENEDEHNIYPVRLQENHNTFTSTHKRKSSEMESAGTHFQDEPFLSPSSLKVQRTVSSSASDSATNQSLMSIIAEKSLTDTENFDSVTGNEKDFKSDSSSSVSHNFQSPQANSSPSFSTARPLESIPAVDWMSLSQKCANTRYDTMCTRKSNHRSWTKEDMEKAISSVKSGALSQRAASRMFNVPQSTIHRRITGKVNPDFYQGRYQGISTKKEQSQLHNT